MHHRYTWRRGKRPQWRASETYELYLAGQRLAIAQKTGDLWFWYGDGKNTAASPGTLEAVKTEAVNHFKANPV